MINRLSILTFLMIISEASLAQSYIGVSMGVNTSKTTYDDPEYKDRYGDNLKFGYKLGLDAVFKVNDSYSLYVSPGFAKRGTSLKSKDEFQVKNRVGYSYIEAPILLQYNLFRSPYTPIIEFGPRVSYWLSGRGRVISLEMEQPQYFNYKLRFRESDGFDKLYVQEANRFQFGLVFGAGWSWKLRNGQKAIITVRYESGSTFHSSRERNNFYYLSYYSHSFRHRNNSVSVNVSYLLNVENVKKNLMK